MSPRIAADTNSYRFQMIDKNTGQPTEYGFDLPSVTSIIGDVLGKPAGAMAWWGYRVAIEGVAAISEFHEDVMPSEPDDVETMLKEHGYDPNKKTSAAGSRGSRAHECLEYLANGQPSFAKLLSKTEQEEHGTKYCEAVIKWWDSKGYDDNDEVVVVSERPVWSLRHVYSGTLDLAVGRNISGAWTWTLLDLKTHKPASGFTKPGQGPAYRSDLVQVRAYRSAWQEMGLGHTIGQRILIARENGTWLEDKRQVPEELWLRIREVYDLMQQFGEA